MLQKLLKKIIRLGVGKTRYVVAGTGLAAALLLILAAVQLQANYHQLLYGAPNQDSTANFLVLNKIIDGNKTDNSLTPGQIEDLRQQPFVDAVGKLASSRFKVSAQSPSDRFPFYTDLFFESVPDAFIDVQSEDWAWREGWATIPLIIPNQFLDLYNFGFAPSQNLVQLTQGMVKALPIVINIHYGGRVQQFNGRVVGFSDRISSVLVPQNFLDWANEQYGTQQATQTSRVVIKTHDAGNPALTAYLKKNGLVTDADKTRFSKYRQVVNTIVNASWVTGAIMLVFALLVFSLFIQVTISSAKNEIALLITLGTSPRQLHHFLLKQFLPTNIVVTVCSLAAIALVQFWLSTWLQQRAMYVKAYPSIYTFITALLIVLVLWLVNSLTIKKYTRAKQ